MDHEHTILSTGLGVGISMALVRPRGPRARPSAFFPDSNEEVSIYSVVDFLPSFEGCERLSLQALRLKSSATVMVYGELRLDCFS